MNENNKVKVSRNLNELITYEAVNLTIKESGLGGKVVQTPLMNYIPDNEDFQDDYEVVLGYKRSMIGKMEGYKLDILFFFKKDNPNFFMKTILHTPDNQIEMIGDSLLTTKGEPLVAYLKEEYVPGEDIKDFLSLMLEVKEAVKFQVARHMQELNDFIKEKDEEVLPDWRGFSEYLGEKIFPQLAVLVKDYYKQYLDLSHFSTVKDFLLPKFLIRDDAMHLVSFILTEIPTQDDVYLSIYTNDNGELLFTTNVVLFTGTSFESVWYREKWLKSLKLVTDENSDHHVTFTSNETKNFYDYDIFLTEFMEFTQSTLNDYLEISTDHIEDDINEDYYDPEEVEEEKTELEKVIDKLRTVKGMAESLESEVIEDEYILEGLSYYDPEVISHGSLLETLNGILNLLEYLVTNKDVVTSILEDEDGEGEFLFYLEWFEGLLIYMTNYESNETCLVKSLYDEYGKYNRSYKNSLENKMYEAENELEKYVKKGKILSDREIRGGKETEIVKKIKISGTIVRDLQRNLTNDVNTKHSNNLNPVITNYRSLMGSLRDILNNLERLTLNDTLVTTIVKKETDREGFISLLDKLNDLLLHINNYERYKDIFINYDKRNTPTRESLQDRINEVKEELDVYVKKSILIDTDPSKDNEEDTEEDEEDYNPEDYYDLDMHDEGEESEEDFGNKLKEMTRENLEDLALSQHKALMDLSEAIIGGMSEELLGHMEKEDSLEDIVGAIFEDSLEDIVGTIFYDNPTLSTDLDLGEITSETIIEDVTGSSAIIRFIKKLHSTFYKDYLPANGEDGIEVVKLSNSRSSKDLYVIANKLEGGTYYIIPIIGTSFTLGIMGKALEPKDLEPIELTVGNVEEQLIKLAE